MDGSGTRIEAGSYGLQFQVQGLPDLQMPS